MLLEVSGFFFFSMYGRRDITIRDLVNRGRLKRLAFGIDGLNNRCGDAEITMNNTTIDFIGTRGFSLCPLDAKQIFTPGKIYGRNNYTLTIFYVRLFLYFIPAIYLVTFHAVFETKKKGKFSDNKKLLTIKICGEWKYKILLNNLFLSCIIYVSLKYSEIFTRLFLTKR